MSEAMIRHLRLPSHRVRTLDNAVDIDLIERLADDQLPIERTPERFVVVHAGRLTRQKNQDLLLRAFKALKVVDAELWMLGNGELRTALVEQAASLGITDRVRWLGFQANPYPFFRAADCFALSSDHEGLPNVVIESMVCGTPVVATRCDFGPEELIEDRVTGYLVPVGDQEAFTRALGQIACNAPAARSMGLKAREATRIRFNTAAVAAQYEALFEDLGGGRS